MIFELTCIVCILVGVVIFGYYYIFDNSKLESSSESFFSLFYDAFTLLIPEKWIYALIGLYMHINPRKFGYFNRGKGTEGKYVIYTIGGVDKSKSLDSSCNESDISTEILDQKEEKEEDEQEFIKNQSNIANITNIAKEESIH